MLGGLELQELVVSIGPEVLRGGGRGSREKTKTERVQSAWIRRIMCSFLPCCLFLFLFFFFLPLWFYKTGSLCCPGTQYVDRLGCLPSAGLKGVR